MALGLIVLISDRPDRSRALAEAVRRVAECRVVGTDEGWDGPDPIRGVIADIGLGPREAERCLRRLSVHRGRAAIPLVLLMRGSTVSPLTASRELGVSLRLPAHSEPGTIVDALVRQIWPDLSQAEFLVRRGTMRAGRLIDDLFRSAGSGPIDIRRVEYSLDPVLDAIGDGGLTRWLDEVWTLDDVTFQHCLLVAGLVAAFARSLGLSMPDQHLMTRAAFVHDIGKARIPPAILNKPGRLDDGEMAVMRTHAAIGHDILLASGGCDPVTLATTRHHHEMLDGTGYPDGLCADEIGDPVRLLTICDIYSALIERRPYKEAVSSTEALGILAGMGPKLEGGLVQAFGRAVQGTP